MKRQTIQRGREVESFLKWICLLGLIVFFGQVITNYVSSGSWWR